MENLHKELLKHKFIVFGFDHYNALGAVRSLGEKGIRPILIIHKELNKRPMLAYNSRYIDKYHIVETVADGCKLIVEKYYDPDYKPFILSCDDFVESYIDLHSSTLSKIAYIFHGRKEGIITELMGKNEISNLASKCGCRIPRAEVVVNGVLPKNLRYPVITKSIKSIEGGWKKDVYVCYSPQELTEAFKHIESEEIKVEEFIEKENELCIDGISVNNGEDVIIPLETSYLRVLPGQYGNYMLFKKFENQVVLSQVKAIMRESGYNGVFCVEYLIAKDGNLYFLEVNWRNSGWSYAFTYGGVNLLYEWCIAQITGDLDIPRISRQITDIPFKAIAEKQDFVDYVLSGRMPFLQWVKDYINTECKFWYNGNDKMPIFCYMANVIKKKVIKIGYKLIGKKFKD